MIQYHQNIIQKQITVTRYNDTNQLTSYDIIKYFII